MKDSKKIPTKPRASKGTQKKVKDHTDPKVWQIPTTQNDRNEKSRNSAIDASPGSDL